MNPKDNIEKNKDVQKKNISNPKNKNNASQTNTSELQKTVEELKQKLKDVEDKLLRSLAENDNLRKRHEKETEDNLKYATKNFALSLLPATDNFQRAMNSVKNENVEENKVLKNLVIGIQAIEKELGDALEKKDSIMSALIESLIAAIYIDSNLDNAKLFIETKILNHSNT